MPFRHVVMFKWTDDVDAAHVETVRAGLDRLGREIGVIRSYVHGSDAGQSDGNYDYAVVADFDDADDWRTYRDHPDHQRFIADHIAGRVAARAAVQFDTASSGR